MKSHLIIILIWVTSLSASQAQKLKYSDYDWDSKPVLHKLSTYEKGLDELILKEKQAVEFVFEENDLLEYKLFHKIIRVNTTTAIEAHNRIYIPSGLYGTFIKHKARIISPKGKIVVQSDKDIKEAVDEESKMTFRFFALEGLEPGSEIEYFYFIKRPPMYTGIKETFQSNVLKKNVEFEIISPINLHFKAKSYNGLADLKTDTSIQEKNILSLKLDTLQALKEEGTSAYKTNLQSVIYKLNSNSFSNKKDIITYGSIAENIYKSMMAPQESGVQKKIGKLIDLMKVKFAKDEEDKVRTLEHYIKTNFSKLENDNKGLDELPVILDKKIANEEGMVKVFAAVLNQLKISYQIVLTCERDELKFDPEFEAYNFLRSYLIYLPSLNMYLAPAEPNSCLGFVPFNLTHNYGLFIKEVNLGTYTTGIGKIKFIDAVAYDKSFENLNINIDFKSEIINPQVNIERQMGGYYASYIQPFYSFFTDEQKTKVTSMLMKDFISNVEIKNVTIENEGKDYFGRKPFIVRSSFVDETLVQKAGDKFLFKVGEVIGHQVEMYQKEDRKTIVENDYNRLYHRIITLKLPEGYKISNPEALNMDVYQEDKGDRPITFTSKYTVSNNVYTITINEYYKKINFQLDEFESYRKVVNAAADFNKITLIIKKS